MRIMTSCFISALVLDACSQGGSGVAGGNITGNQTVSNSTVEDSINNTVGSYNNGTGGGGGPVSVPVNLALDPAVFDKLFNPAVSVVKAPAAAAIKSLQQQAVQNDDTSLETAAANCLKNLAKCTIFKK